MPHDDASLSTANPDLTVVERRVLARIYQHPLSHNLSWREVIELFSATGEVEHAHNGNLVLKLGADHLVFKTAHDKDLAADDVMALRHFLTRAGWTPTSMPAKPLMPAKAAIAIVLDHASARIYDLALDDAHQTPQETHHLLNTIDREQHEADRQETDPANHRFFDAIATDMPSDAPIVVVSHGKGQSNEGNHLLDYLEEHYRTLNDRIARVIVADLPHPTVPQQLKLARDALLCAPESAEATTD